MNLLTQKLEEINEFGDFQIDYEVCCFRVVKIMFKSFT